MTRIKICGLFREEDAACANEALPDYAGFVFAPSRRQVSPALAARIRALLDGNIVPVGVFVNAPAADIAALYREGIIDMAQLHGDEDAAYIGWLKELSAGDRRGPLPLIKALSAARLGAGVFPTSLDSQFDPDLPDYLFPMAKGLTRTRCRAEMAPGKTFGIPCRSVSQDSGGRLYKRFPGSHLCPAVCFGSSLAFPGGADYYLIDNGSGGTGKSFDWGLIEELRQHSPLDERPWFLAGGIGLHNIKAALALSPFGLDISGGAETGGFKDREKMVRLTQMVREGTSKGSGI